ncbi:MAG: amidohydrolase family protein, partial [Acidobacteriota bacterium]
MYQPTIRRLALALCLLAVVASRGPAVTAQSAAVTIHAALMIDGRGGQRPNVLVTVNGGKVTAVGAAAGTPTYDLGGLTLLPGFIDTHVHIGWHFDDHDRFVSGQEPEDVAALYGAENAYVTLLAGFTTIQSVGARSDGVLRAALARGVLPGPRLLTSLGQIANPKMTPDDMRAAVKKFKSD